MSQPGRFESIIVDQKEKGDVLTISSAYRELWEIEEGTFQHVVFGSREIPCTIHYDETLKDKQLVVSKSVSDFLLLPKQRTCLTIIFDEDNRLYLGPIIGIFTAGFTGSNLRPVGERSFLFAKYAKAAQLSGAIAVIFGVHHIHWEEGITEGCIFTEKGWQTVRVPLPNVIYDRLPNRKTERLSEYRAVSKRLKEEYNIPMFNPGFFDKWEIHEKLSLNEKATPFLAKTLAYPKKKDIREFIENCHHIYMKPKNGSLGMGIHQIVFKPDEGFYYCRFRDHEKNRLRRYSSIDRLLKTQFKGGFEHFVVQEGISLLAYQNKPIDFRVHTNKDINGKWTLSALAAKVAGPGSVTTHVKSGGQVKSVAEIWEDLQLNKTLLNELKEAALLLSECIDEAVEGNVGEIGFDLGIDKNEKIWMFEANSKPGRTIFSHPKLRYDDQLTRRLPMEYAIYLHTKSIDSQIGMPEYIVNQ
ncbi:YheC/YheD family protein [Bacillus shivajii]|uniref:YheC/YheD family endospore coat-associated protein n=1 Tax=Bacillus shivajii TaxID=1983719 RepID=UPI001CFBDEE2|nr:YheC/YheD family protein [Bacillus shivajii]UCZ54295.1 YheC/YheD family protein [Bacillus shivajii]